MSDHRTTGSDERDAVGRLIGLAGPRPEASAEELERLTSAGRDLWRASLDSRRREQPDVPTPRRTRPGRWLALAALVVVGVGIAVLLRSTIFAPVLGEVVVDSADPDRVGSQVREGSVWQVATGEVVTLDVADAQLRLAGDTRLRVEAADRLRLGRGAVFVDTDRRADALAVVTDLGRAVDVGTRFQVGYRQGEMSVRVREGLVRLEAASGESSDGSESSPVERSAVEIGAGQGARLSPAGELDTFDDDGWGEAWRWVESASPGFRGAAEGGDGADLDAVLRWVAAETGWRLRYADAELARRADSIRVGGSLAGLAPRQALEVVTAASELAWRVEGGVLWVEPPEMKN